jgi:uncharacterized protein YlxW (UPF0749 family)
MAGSGPLSPASLTNLVLAIGAMVAAWVVPVVLTRRPAVKDDTGQDASATEAWTALNGALQTEVRRLQETLNQQRADYQSQLDAARRRITELEQEVSALQRALRGGTA